MDPELTPTPEELVADKEALAEAKAEEVRAKLVSDLGLSDDETNKPVLDKLVERELKYRKDFGNVVGKKIKFREELQKARTTTPPTEKKDQVSYDPEALRKQTEDAVTARLEQRDLDEMDYPDEIKAQIKHVAQVQGISVRKAEKDGYIQHLLKEAVKAGKIDEATVSRTPRTTPAGKTEGKMPTFDMSTEDGRKAFDQWKKDNGK